MHECVYICLYSYTFTNNRDALRHEYFHMYPYPKDSDLMPTFPSLHDNLEDGKVAVKDKKSPLDLK